RILDALAPQGVIDAAELALAHRQLQAMPALAAPRRPDALHAVLHYESLAKEGRMQSATASDPRIRTTLDLDLQRQVTSLARRHLAAWRASGAEQVAVMV